MKLSNYAALCAVVMVVFACNNPQKSNKKQVICTTGLIADAVQNILPKEFEVSSLMGPGVDPHTYKSKSSELKALMSADAIVYNGIHFESNLIDALHEIEKTSFVIALGEIVPRERLRKTTEFGSNNDPHFWHDVNLFATAIKLAGERFSLKYPAHKAYIDSATNAYYNQLLVVEKATLQQIATIPDSSKVLITAHDAFGYFGRAFDIEVIGVQGISTASDISIRGITELVDMIVAREIPSIFVENSVSTKNIKSVIEGCAAKGLELKIGGTLYSDGLGDEASGANTYIKMISKNVQTITEALKK